MPDNPEFDAIIVGAGFAGLKAATLLKAAGKKIKVLEARERVGGRVKPGKVAGEVVDLGGQWVGPQQKKLLAEAEAQKVETRPQPREGKTVWEMGAKRHVVKDGALPLPFLSMLEVDRIVKRWGREMKTLPPEAPWTAEKAQEWDNQTLHRWMEKTLWTRHAKYFVRLVARAVICAEAEQISYLGFLEYLRSGHGLEVLISTRNGAQQDKFRGGAWSIADKMSQSLKKDILFEEPVTAIRQNEAGIEIITAKEKLIARKAILALSPVLASKIAYDPPLPALREGLAQRMPMGSVIKVHVAYDKPFWLEQGLSGSAIGTHRYFNAVFDQSPEDGSKGILVGFFDGRHAVEATQMGENRRRALVLEDLAAYFGPKAAHPIDYVENVWLDEVWSRGGYVAHFPPGVMTIYGEALRTPCGNIHWAGTETATEWMGYIDGALQSGIRAAEEVLETL